MRLSNAVLMAALFVCSTSYKILVYNSKYAHSHSNIMGNIADTLADAGHNVTSLIPEIDPTLKDGTTKTTVIRVRSEEARKLRLEMLAGPADRFGSKLMDNKFVFVLGPMFAKVFGLNCRAVLNEPGLLEKLKAENYDVMVAESFEMCGVGLTHILQPKSVVLVSGSNLFGPQFDEFGVPPSLSFNPSAYMTSMNVHSIWDRVMNLYADYLIRQFYGEGRARVDEAFREKYGKDFPTFEEISSRAAYVLENSEPLLDFASPTLNKVIKIGGIGAKPAQKLDEHWHDVLGRREKNVLISFGSIAKSIEMKQDQKDAVLKMISNFPDVTFIWKYENVEDNFVKSAKAKHSNVVFESWTPQNDILAHENMTVFITHGGMGSVLETAMRGVPALMIPLFGDHPRNSAAAKSLGIGTVFDKFDLNDDKKLTAALRELLTEKIYKKNVVRISKMLAAKPYKTRDMLIKHVEFAAEFGPSSSLRPQSHDMSFIEFHNLDILFIICVFLVILGVLTFICLNYSCRFVCKKLGLCGKRNELLQTTESSESGEKLLN